MLPYPDRHSHCAPRPPLPPLLSPLVLPRYKAEKLYMDGRYWAAGGRAWAASVGEDTAPEVAPPAAAAGAAGGAAAAGGAGDSSLALGGGHLAALEQDGEGQRRGGAGAACRKGWGRSGRGGRAAIRGFASLLFSQALPPGADAALPPAVCLQSQPAALAYGCAAPVFEEQKVAPWHCTTHMYTPIYVVPLIPTMGCKHTDHAANIPPPPLP